MATSSINATPTHHLANSYASEAEADQYFADRLAATGWTGASSDDKKKALLEAARRVSAFRYHFAKYETSPEQALEFPRSNSRALSGSVDSASTTKIIDAAFIDAVLYPADYFNGWAIKFLDGSSIEGVTALVTDYNATTGEFTVETLTAAPVAGDQFQVIEKVPDAIKRAQFEIAIWLLNGAEAEGDPDPDVKDHSIGNFSETFVDGHGSQVRLPRKAFALLQKYISRTGTIE